MATSSEARCTKEVLAVQPVPKEPLVRQHTLVYVPLAALWKMKRPQQSQQRQEGQQQGEQLQLGSHRGEQQLGDQQLGEQRESRLSQQRARSQPKRTTGTIPIPPCSLPATSKTKMTATSGTPASIGPKWRTRRETRSTRPTWATARKRSSFSRTQSPRQNLALLVLTSNIGNFQKVDGRLLFRLWP